MPAKELTWTEERLELLKTHFAAGLTCREIAGDIGVSRNAVIGKLSRLNLTREKTGDAPRPARKDRDAPKGHRRGSVPRLQYRILQAVYAEPLADLDPGRRGFLLLRQHPGRGPALLSGPLPARLPRRLAPARRAGLNPNPNDIVRHRSKLERRLTRR